MYLFLLWVVKVSVKLPILVTIQKKMQSMLFFISLNGS